MRFLTEIGRFAFLSPLWEVWEQRTIIILGSLESAWWSIELFSLGVTAEALRANIGSISAISLQRGPDDPKFQIIGVTPTNHFFLENYAKRSFVWYNSLDRSFHRFVTLRACDRQTDGRTDRILIARPRLHSIQGGNKNRERWPPRPYSSSGAGIWVVLRHRAAAAACVSCLTVNATVAAAYCMP